MNIWKENKEFKQEKLDYSIKSLHSMSRKEHIQSKSKFLVKVESDILSDCKSIIVDIERVGSDVVVEIPVYLSNFILKIPLNFLFRMPYGASNINEVKNRVRITECRLIKDTGAVFVKGIVRMNIYFNSFHSSHVITAIGKLKHCIIDIPFKCTTDVNFNYMSLLPVIESKTLEYTFVNKPNIPIENPKIGRTTTEEYNSQLFCCISDSRILQSINITKMNIVESLMKPYGILEEINLESKMVIEAKIAILQRRDVLIKHRN